MFVRTKEVGGRRYVYLVEGFRDGALVRQKTVCYLGPLYRMTAGVPDTTRRRLSRRLDVDWSVVNAEIVKIPLALEEVEMARRTHLALSVRARSSAGRPTQGGLPRTEGELAALTRLASTRFRESFDEMGPLTYVMR